MKQLSLERPELMEAVVRAMEAVVRAMIVTLAGAVRLCESVPVP